MKTTLFAAFLALLGLCAVGTVGAAETVPLEVGIASADITPPLDFPISGYYNERLSTGTSDPLLAKALVFQQGETLAALVVCDVISIPAKLTDEIRQQASEATGIPVSAIIITATHTHTGPLFGSKSADYEKELVPNVVGAILSAQKNLRQATLEVGSATVEKLSFNRRFHMKEGPVVFNPGFNNPNIVRPAAGIDPECPILLFRDADGQPFASLTNFALHLDTTGGLLFSADYPFYLSEAMKEKFGPDFFSVFGTGTCGDINHLDFAGGLPRLKAPEIGKKLGAFVTARIDEGLAPTDASLGVAEEIAMYPRQQFSDEQVAAAKADADTVYDPDNAKKKTFLERVEIGKIIKLSRMPEEVRLDVQAIRLSDDTAIVTLPGEVFVDLGLAIKASSPFKHTLVIELAQDQLSYIPTKKAFAEGSYETINSVVMPGGGEKLVEMAVESLNSLKERN